MMIDKKGIVIKCRKLMNAYRLGILGNMTMPEDANPGFAADEREFCLTYFTLPMSLNYQRDSYRLWGSALETYKDSKTRMVFDIKKVSGMAKSKLRYLLLKHRLALQPNKHIENWYRISKTIHDNWGGIGALLRFANYDFLKLKDIIQRKYKKGFPYLSGPKIFNYWSSVIQKYSNIKLKNSQFIEIAPDTHIIKCSIALGVINQKEAIYLPKERISEKWRGVLEDTGISPMEMHAPLWFWSRNHFQFKLI